MCTANNNTFFNIRYYQNGQLLNTFIYILSKENVHISKILKKGHYAWVIRNCPVIYICPLCGVTKSGYNWYISVYGQYIKTATDILDYLLYVMSTTTKTCDIYYY
jgi:hypothetical protein